MLPPEQQEELRRTLGLDTAGVLDYLASSFIPWFKENPEEYKGEAVEILEFLQGEEIDDKTMVCRREEVGKAIDILLRKIEKSGISVSDEADVGKRRVSQDLIEAATNDVSLSAANSSELLGETFGKAVGSMDGAPAFQPPAPVLSLGK